MLSNTVAIIVNLGAAVTAATVPFGNVGTPTTLERHYRPLETSTISGTVEKRHPPQNGDNWPFNMNDDGPDYAAWYEERLKHPKKDDGPNYAAINDILSEGKHDDDPDYAAFQEVWEQPDPLWHVFVEPGKHPREFTAFCSEAPVRNELRCFHSPKIDPWHFWKMEQPSWDRCIKDERETGRTPQMSCFNWDNMVHNGEPKPDWYLDFPADMPLTYWGVGGGIACAQPWKGKINCAVMSDPAPVHTYTPDSGEKGEADLFDCYRQWDRCAADYELFYTHDNE